MPSNVSITGDDAITLDMVGQYTFCPRRFHLMYVEGRWDDNAYTVEGRHIHRRVDQLDHLLPEAQNDSSTEIADDEKPSAAVKPKRGHPSTAATADAAGDEPPVISRSVPLASSELGLSAKLDLVSSDGAEAVPVETKRGRVPDNADRCHDTHRVQLMAQGLLLREHGYDSDHGVVYFAGSRTRVDVQFTPQLEVETIFLIAQTRAAVSLAVIPDPLEDSPKCNGCSLAGICLPDETLALRALRHIPGGGDLLASPPLKPRHDSGDEGIALIRRLYPPRPDATPLYVQTQGASVSKRGQSLLVRAEGEELTRVGLRDVGQLVLCGIVQVSMRPMHLLCEADIPVVMLSSGMWFYGISHGQSLRNAYDRAAQFHAAADSVRCLAFARALVRDKATNQRTQLRRNAPPSQDLDRVMTDFDDTIERVSQGTAIDSLLGVEGNAARIYFSRFAQMLKPRDFDAATAFDFNCRNRRPPRDPVNAMLSFAYAMLAKECTVALLSEGLDPYWGFYHRPRHGRPALALDLMEPFRPVIADSAVITAINTSMVRAKHFERTASACAMNDAGRKGLLSAYESRLDQLITHPLFDYRCSWRSVIRLQARLLSRWLRGDVPDFTNLVAR